MSFLDVDGVRVAYRVDGRKGAPTLLFSNSLGTSLEMWDPQVAVFGDHFQLVRYDSRGHGSSEAPPGPYSLERLARDALALLDHLRIQRVHLCGLSMGGLVAQWLALHHPRRIGRAVLANTGSRIGDVAMWDARIAAVQSGGMLAVRNQVLARFLSEPFRATHPDTSRRFSRMLENTPPDGYVAACQALRDADLTPEVGSLKLPVLVVAGELDAATPLALSQALHARIAGSELVVLPSAHLSNVEQTDRFNEEVLQFLTRPSAG